MVSPSTLSPKLAVEPSETLIPGNIGPLAPVMPSLVSQSVPCPKPTPAPMLALFVRLYPRLKWFNIVEVMV